MNVLLLDTNVVSILFNLNHQLRQTCIDIVAGNQLVISFMTRAELLLWPTTNNWGDSRTAARQWSCPLVTTDFRDYDAIENLDVIPVHYKR
jgi:predicted nucleic acid-binding protein